MRTQELATQILVMVSNTRIREYFETLPLGESIVGYEDVEGTWLKALGHIPTYRLICDVAKLVEQSLPSLIQTILDDRNASS